MDRISDLPKEILQRILYFLSQEEAVRTSVLSKSWRYIWCTRSNLDLDFSNPKFETNEHKFISVVNNTLQRYCDQRLCLEEFRLKIWAADNSYRELVSHLEKYWIGRLNNMGVKDFRLYINWVHCTQRLFEPPCAVFEAESLKFLHLRNCMLGRKSTPVKIASERLQELRLRHVEVEKETLDKILSSCPLLTTIFFQFCKGFKTIKLEKKLHKYLKNLTFIDDYSRCRIEIDDFPTIETINISWSKIQFLGNKFTNLKSLTLNKVQIYSDSVEKSQLICDIDAPNISYFEYSGVFIPSISFTPTSGRSKLELYMDGVVDAQSWFLKLGKLLQALSQSEISLGIVKHCCSVVHIQEDISVQDIINGGGDKPVVVEHLEFGASLLFQSSLSGLLCICRPRNITPGWCASMSQREQKKLIEHLCKTLTMTQSGNQDLEDLRIESFDRTVQKWQHVPRATLLECALPGSKIRFRLKWSNACESSSKLQKIEG